MEKLHRTRLTAVLAANTHLQLGSGGPALLHGDVHQLAYPDHVNALEGIHIEDALVEVGGQELAGIVAGQAQGCLGQVVGSKREELGHLGHLVGGQGRSRQLDHGSNQVGQLQSLLREHGLGRGPNGLGLVVQLGHIADEGNHDLGQGCLALFLHDQAGRFHDGPGLHGGDLRIGDA